MKAAAEAPERGLRATKEKIISYVVAAPVFLVILVLAEHIAGTIVDFVKNLPNLPRPLPIWLRGHFRRGRPLRHRGLGL